MVKNLGGGNKTKKQKRNFGRFDAVDKIEQGQMFAQIIQNNGGNFSVLCSDGVSRIGKLCGFIKKGPRIINGSFVVISLREFESEQKKCDIISYGDPPNDILDIFKKNSLNKNTKEDIEFNDSDDEFKEFEESKRTIINVDNKNKNKNDDEQDIKNKDNNDEEFDWNDII